MDAGSDFAGFVRRIRKGDETAASELIHQYEQELRIIVRIRLKDARLRRVLDSTDICQSVLANFFAQAAAGQFDLESTQDLMNLLATMIRNKVTDYVRAQNGPRRSTSQSSTPQCIDTLDLASPDETPSTIVANKELIDKVRQRLSKDELQIIDLRRDGHSWDSISSIIGESAEALRKRFSRAIDRVSTELGLPHLFEV